MVIDDSEVVLTVTRIMLQATGFDVVVCDSPVGAVLRVVSELPDIVLVDLQMASISGDRVVTALKGGARTAGIRVCLYTSTPFSEAQEIMRRCRADGFIQKGSDKMTLAAAIRRVLSR